MQSRVVLDFYVDIQCNDQFNYAECVQAVIAAKCNADIVADGSKFNPATQTAIAGCCPKLVFSGGDAFIKGVSSMTVQVNGAAVSQHNFHLYMRTLADAWISPEAYQARFSQCGGIPSRFDSRPVSGHSIVALNAGEGRAMAVDTPVVFGFTGDSGVDTRAKNLLNCIDSYQTTVATAGEKIRVRCQVPIWGTGLFNPFSPTDKIADSCPLTKSLNALCHMNNWSVEFLFEDLLQNIFRNLGIENAGGTNTLIGGSKLGGYTCTLVTDIKPALETVWLRLPSYRLIPERIVASTFRITTHRESSKNAPNLTNIDTALTRQDVGTLENFLPSVGVCRNSRMRSAKLDSTKYYESIFTAIQMAQPPQYLLFCFQKSSKLYVQGGSSDFQIGRFDTYAARGAAAITVATDAEAPGLDNYFFARNADANAGVGDFSLTVLSSVGAYTYSSEKFPYLKKRRELWTDVQKNCVADYCDNDMSVWLKNKCCILLHISDYIRGLSTENTAFPLQLDARVKWYNYRDFVDGHCAAALAQTGPAFLKDAIQGVPTLALIYTGGAMQITSSSAVTSTANLSHSSASDILARRGG
jgi:hypothetical protein